MTEDPTLLSGGGKPGTAGYSTFLDSHPGLVEPHPRIYVKFQPQGLDFPVLGLVDTGGHFCILNRDVGPLLLGSLGARIDRLPLRTAYGIVEGDLYRHWIELVADEGPSLDVEVTVFLSPDWQGPCFLGYSGVLERMRFAVHPQANRFYFAPLH